MRHLYMTITETIRIINRKYVVESEPFAAVMEKGRYISALGWQALRTHAQSLYKTPTILDISSRKIRQYQGGEVAESLRKL